MKKSQDLVSALIMFFGMIVLGFCIIYASTNHETEISRRYEIVQLNSSNVAIIDNQTNKIYYKYVSPLEGPANWVEFELPN